MPTEYNKSHIQGILQKNGKKIQHCIILYRFFREVISKNSCIVFHHDFQTLENNKSTRPKQPRAFICFLVFGNRGETLALAFEIVLRQLLPTYDMTPAKSRNNCKMSLECRPRKEKKIKLENPGIDPGTSRMLSGRSTI